MQAVVSGGNVENARITLPFEHRERGKKWLQGTGPASGIPNLASGSLSDYVCAALREDA